MSANNLFSSFIYILIFVSSWAIVETSVELISDKKLVRIGIFAIILIISCSIYTFGLKREIDFRNITLQDYKEEMKTI
jgi:hypothetical protein